MQKIILILVFFIFLVGCSEDTGSLVDNINKEFYERCLEISGGDVKGCEESVENRMIYMNNCLERGFSNEQCLEALDSPGTRVPERCLLSSNDFNCEIFSLTNAETNNFKMSLTHSFENGLSEFNITSLKVDGQIISYIDDCNEINLPIDYGQSVDILCTLRLHNDLQPHIKTNVEIGAVYKLKERVLTRPLTIEVFADVVKK